MAEKRDDDAKRDPKELSNRIKGLRNSKTEWSKHEFAEQCRIDRHRLQAWEKGEDQPSVDNLLRIAEATKVDANWLLGRVGSADEPIYLSQSRPERKLFDDLRAYVRRELVRIVSRAGDIDLPIDDITALVAELPLNVGALLRRLIDKQRWKLHDFWETARQRQEDYELTQLEIARTLIRTRAAQLPRRAHHDAPPTREA